MAQVTIKICELNEDDQYQSIAAFITIDKEDFLLESRLIDNEDYQTDLEVVEGFFGMWEIRAETENFRFEVDESVTEVIIEFSSQIEMLDDDEPRSDSYAGHDDVDEDWK